MYLGEFYNLSDAAELDTSSWLYYANEVANRCGEAIDPRFRGSDTLEHAADAVVLEAERLARALDPDPNSSRVRAFVIRALSDAAAHSTSSWPAHAQWFEEMGVADLAAQLGRTLASEPYHTLANDQDVAAATEKLLSFWRHSMDQLGG